MTRSVPVRNVPSEDIRLTAVPPPKVLSLETLPVLLKLIASAPRRSIPPVTVPLLAPLIAPPTLKAKMPPFCVPLFVTVKVFEGLATPLKKLVVPL